MEVAWWLCGAGTTRQAGTQMFRPWGLFLLLRRKGKRVEALGTTPAWSPPPHCQHSLCLGPTLG